MSNVDPATIASFGREWTTFDQSSLPESEGHRLFEAYFSEFPWACLPRLACGFDAGCGSGRWSQRVAPMVGQLHCVDASPDALEVAKRNLSAVGIRNAFFHVGSIESLPFLEDSMDFGYSLGVLHHCPDPLSALRSCVRRLKPGAPFLLYLYYALDDRPAYYRALWKLSDHVRRRISRLPHRTRLLVTTGIAMTCYLPLARTARAVERAGKSPEGIPLAFYRNASFYTMRTDAYDRFATPLEHRFSKPQIENMMREAGLRSIRFREEAPFWCAVGHRGPIPSDGA